MEKKEKSLGKRCWEKGVGKREMPWIITFIAWALMMGCDLDPQHEENIITNSRDTLVQVSVIDALLQGMYDGIYPIGKLLNHGNTGIGTFHALEGEMVVLNDTVFQVLASGQVLKPALETTTPFAAIAPFIADTAYTLTAFTFDSLKQNFDRYFPTQNIFYVIKMKGEFEYMRTRSVPRQEKPYKPLVEVTVNQPEFGFEKVQGDIVGFFCPEYAKGVNVTGFHLHFLTSDRSGGGHILNFNLKNGSMEIGYLFDYRLILPEGGDFFGGDFSIDRQDELEEVEK